MAGDAAAFQETVRQLLSGNNKLRKPAEKRYEDAKRNQPTATLAALFQIVQESQIELPVREQGAVLLRQCLNRAGEPGSLWHGLGEAAQTDARLRLLQLLEIEPVRPLRRKIADAVQSLGNSTINIDSDARPNNIQEWPELMPTLLRVVADGSRDSGIRADCLWAVKEMAISVWQVLLANAEQTQQLLFTCLSDPADQVKADTVSLLCSFADSIESREDRKPFEPLIPQVCMVLSQLAAAPDPTAINEVLQAMQVTTEVADYFKEHISSHILPLMSRIAMSHSDCAARKYALEVLLSFLQSKPKLLMKSPEFVQSILEVCIHLLVQLPDELSDWLEDDPEEGGEAEECDEEVLFACGKEAIDRVSRCAQRVDSFSMVLEVLKPVIARYIQSASWKEVVAAITTLREIAEYIDDEVLVSQMMQAIKLQLQASHPRARHAAWSAVAQFSVDHGDVISTDTWVAELMPMFVGGLGDGCLRVCVRSMEAFQHYGENVERDDIESFLPALMERLGAKLQGGPMLQRKAIAYVAVIARQSEEAFAPYCSPLMPVLKGTIQATLHKVEERTLLGRCFECISLLAKAMGREAFQADAELIMQAMVQATQVPDLPKDDPVKEYMMSACERICGALKEDFLPFVPHVLPGILEKLRTAAPRQLDADSAAGDDDEELEEGTEVTVVREGSKFKVMTMNISDMQDLKGALECVLEFAGQMGKAYAQYVSQTAQAILPIFDFSMAEEIRNLAFETWGQLCRCANDGGHPQVVSELLMEFLKRILPKLEDSGKGGIGVDVFALKTRSDGITSCLRHAGADILSSEQVKHLCNVAMSLTGDSLKRREESTEAAHADKRKDKSDDDGGIFVITDGGEDDEEEQALRTSLMEIAGAVMQHHPDAFMAEAFPSYLALVQQLAAARAADTASCTDDRQLALCVACDFLEHLGTRVTAQWPQFLPLLLDDVMHTDAQVRTAACFGLSLAAKETAFSSLATTAVGKLAELIVQSRQREKRKAERTAQAAADNALSALAEILLNHAAALGALSSPTEHQLWAIWIAGLPCQEDEAEGVRNHSTLLRLLQQEKPEVVGEGGANVAKLLGILVDQHQTDMVNEETSKGIGQLLLRLGTARLETYAAQYTAKQRKRLQRIVEEAQREAKA